jgi:hypothetical protein
MAAQRPDVADLGPGPLGRRRDLLLVVVLRPGHLVEQVLQGGLVVARAVEVGQQVVRAVVDQDDALRLLVVDVQEGGGDLFPAQVLGRLQRVVSGQHLHGRAVDDDRAVLAVGLEAGLDGLDVAAAGVVRVGAQLSERDRQGF